MWMACLIFAVIWSSKSLHAHNGILLYISDGSAPYGRAVLCYFPTYCPNVDFWGSGHFSAFKREKSSHSLPGVLRLFCMGSGKAYLQS